MIARLFLIITSMLFSSCATILNSNIDSINVVTNEPTRIKIEDDTLHTISKNHFLRVERSKDSLEITAFSSLKNKKIEIKSRNSFAYWLNLYPSSAWIGFLIDKNNPKRYNYPNTIYIDLNDSTNDYLTYKPLDSTIKIYDNIIKIKPLKAISIINSGLEISYEKRISNSFSTELSAAYLFPNYLLDLGSDFNHDINGFQLGIEEKYFLKKSAPIGTYLSLELKYLQNQYSDIARFGVADIYSDDTYDYSNYPDTFRISKNTFSINFKVGYQYLVNRFSFDFYAGIGAKYKDVEHSDRINPDDEMEMPRHPNLFYITNNEGKYWDINIPLNIKIGWAF